MPQYQILDDMSDFYPRSPCGERRARRASRQHPAGISIHALLAESDGLSYFYIIKITIFLSTLSLRRATSQQPDGTTRTTYFYPRSPCGERRVTVLGIQHRVGISIHALLAESDVNEITYQRQIDQFLSTLSLRRATAFFLFLVYLLFVYFYPRSPCGERHRDIAHSER